MVLRDVSLRLERGEVIGTARAERLGQDHLLLCHRRADSARRRAGAHRRGGGHRPADVSPRAAGHRLSAAGGLDLPRALRGCC